MEYFPKHKSERTHLINMTTIVFFSLCIVLFCFLILNGIGSSLIYDDNTLMFLAISILSLVFTLTEAIKRAYSLAMFHWLFIFLFFGVAGLVQYTTGRFVYAFVLQPSELLYVNFLILLWMFMFFLGSRVKLRYLSFTRGLFTLVRTELHSSRAFISWVTVISSLIMIYALSKGGVGSIFSRGTSGLAFTQGDQATSQLLMTSARNFVLYGLVMSISFYIKNKRALLLVFVQIIDFLIVDSPFGLQRFDVAVSYIGLMLLIFKSFKKNRWFVFVFFCGLTLIFPMLDAFRHTSVFDVSNQSFLNPINNVIDNFATGNYDAYSMLIYTHKYVSSNGVTYGHQLLGALLFFIPRSIWPTKPVGTGAFILSHYGYLFTNGSDPLVAEALVNFGLIGVVLFALASGRLTGILDQSYWSGGDGVSYLSLLYPFTLSMFFFMLRGDLLDTFAYSVSNVVVFSVMFWVNNRMAMQESVRIA